MPVLSGFLWSRRESDPRPHACGACALPTELRPLDFERQFDVFVQEFTRALGMDAEPVPLSVDELMASLLKKNETDQVLFHSFTHEKDETTVQYEQSNTFAGLKNNAISAAFNQLLDEIYDL